MIGVVGINHKTASQDIRELFAFAREDIKPFSELAGCNTGISEVVVLSTCNRTEVYYSHEGSCDERVSELLISLLHEFKVVPQKYGEFFYRYSNIDAVRHLFRVTSGMDSMVIGEDQIVNQVKEAYFYCEEVSLTNGALMRLFQKCFETSKRVRTETEIKQGISSISNAAVDLCSRLYDDLPERSVMFVGAGDAGRLALHFMVKKGVTKTYIANRTCENAMPIARDNNSTLVQFDEIYKYLPVCDIIIVATGAPDYILRKDDIERVMTERNYGRQVYIDLSVPRNIENPVSEIENVTLYGVDDMQQIIGPRSGAGIAALNQANEIIDEMAEDYMLWHDCLALRPVIKTITSSMNKIREDEMNAYKGVEDAQKFELIDEYTNRITQKYIGVIIKNLREVSKSRPSSQSLNMINKIFMVDNGQDSNK